MKVLVAVKHVVDYNVKVRVKSDGSGVELANVKMSINPFDENAVEEAIRLKESGKASEVILVSVGSSKSEETLRTGLAMGADREILMETGEQTIEPLAVAKILQKVAQSEQADLVILGIQVIDDDCNQTGQMLSALLDWPQDTFVSVVDVLSPEKVNVTREVDGGLQTLHLCLPAVVTTDLRLNEPRFASLPNIMKAKKKPIAKLFLADVSLSDDVIKTRLTMTATEEPATRQAGIKVDNIAELIEKLKNEAGVL